MKMDSGKAKMMGMLLAFKGGKKGKPSKATKVAEAPKKKKKDRKRTMLASALMY